MADLTYEAGITVGIPGKDKFNMAKPVLRWTIDSAGDVDEQIEQHKAALEKLAPAVEEALGQELANISGLSVSGAGQGAAITKLEKLLEFTINEQVRLKGVLEDAGLDKPPTKKRRKKSGI